MKKCILIFCISLFSLVGCKQVDSLTHFNLEYNETVVIPSSTGITLPFSILTPDIQSNSENEFSINDTRKDMIEHISIKKLLLTINSPTNTDFSFFKSVHVYISAEGLNKVEVAWKDPVPASTSNILELDLSGADMQEYIKKDNFSLELSTVTDEVLTSDTEININSIFYVDAKVLGQ